MMRSAAALALVSLLASSPSYAFVPLSSSFTYNVANHGSMAKAQASRNNALSSGVALSMGVADGLVKAHQMFVYAARPDLAMFDGLLRAAKSSMTNAAKNIESKSPEKELNKALMAMQNDLVKIQQAYAETVDRRRRMIHKKNQIELVADSWYRRAQYALRRGYERSARDALLQRQPYVDAAESLGLQIDAQSAAIERLYEGALLLGGKFHEAVAKKSDLAARAKVAQSVKEVNDILSGLTGDNSLDAFDKLEEKVEALEAEAEASSKHLIGSATSTETAAEAGLELEFKALEGQDQVDKELKQMKGNLDKEKKWRIGRAVSDVPLRSLKSDDEIARELEELLGRKVIETGHF